MRPRARQKAVASYFTHTQTRLHTLSLVNGIKQLGDNSPDGQTRNQASISLPASSSPYPFNRSISFTHTHRHLPHTWNYNYIFHFPTAATQLPRWQFPQLINQNHRIFIVRPNNPPPHKLVSSKRASLTNQLANAIQERGHVDGLCFFFSLHFSAPAGSLLPKRMTDMYHLLPHTLRWGWEAGEEIGSVALFLSFHSHQL